MSTVPVEVQSNPTALALPGMAQGILEVAESYTIDSAEMFSLAGQELRTIATKRKQIEEERLKITRPLDATKAAIMTFFKRPTELLEKAEAVLKQSMIAYESEQRRKADEERRAAEARARQEREAAAKAQREAEEVARKAEEAAAAESNKAEAERLSREAKDARAAAAEAQAQVELAEVAPPLPAVIAPKADGVSFRTTWKAEVTSLADLVAECANRPELLGLLTVDVPALNEFARRTKGALQVTGVRFYEDKTAAARRVA